MAWIEKWRKLLFWKVRFSGILKTLRLCTRVDAMEISEIPKSRNPYQNTLEVDSRKKRDRLFGPFVYRTGMI